MIPQHRINELIDSLATDQNIYRLVRKVEAEAYEAAALICDLCGTSAIPATASADNCAAAIRALKDKP